MNQTEIYFNQERQDDIFGDGVNALYFCCGHPLYTVVRLPASDRSRRGSSTCGRYPLADEVIGRPGVCEMNNSDLNLRSDQ